MVKTLLFLTLLSTLSFASYSGQVIDKKTYKPVPRAMISDSKHTVYSDKDGYFSIDSNETRYFIKAYGYRPYNFASTTKLKKLALRPITIHALYLTFWGASGNSQTMKNIFRIIDKSNVNAIVVDMKNEYGSTMFKTSFQEANSYGAHKNRTNRNIQRFMKMMKDRDIYTIARIVTFKDEIQASHNPQYAIKNAKGEIWRNADKMAWVDPFNIKSHNYTIRIAQEAAKVGFDEINFDYIRFPAKSDLHYSKINNQKNRIKAISDFLDEAKQKLRKYGVFISVDIYGNVCWSKDDNGIGQTIPSLAKHVDYIAPMLYPSCFSSGSFNFKHPAKHPYHVIYRSVLHIKDMINPQRVRPWLQYFKDYSVTRLDYNAKEVQEQIRATIHTKTDGWMLWSPSSNYKLNCFNGTIKE